ncbi:MAG: FHA domain-containing protein [Phycisphaerae bacterium]
MDCQLLLISDPARTDVRVKLLNGDNVIGRTTRSLFKTESPQVSFEHCVLMLGTDDCQVENLSSFGTFVNDTKVTTKTRLRHKDVLRLAPDLVFRVEMAADQGSLLSGRAGTLVLAFFGILALGLVALFVFGGDSQPPAQNWDYTQKTIAQWLDRRTGTNYPEAQRFPQNLPFMFREGWRLENSRDYVGAKKAWTKVSLLMANLETRRPGENSPFMFSSSAMDESRALQMLLSTPTEAESTALTNAPPPSEKQMQAALYQFVMRRLEVAIRNSR